MATAFDSNGRSRGRKNKKKLVQVNEDSPVIKAFRGYQKELDTKHDRHERIVKLSRDITIESKRAIFLLQRCAGGESADAQDILNQAQSKLSDIQQTKFQPLASELMGQDHYQFIRAYTPGLQEYIEAASFYHYLKEGSLVSIDQLQKELQFPELPAHSGTAEGANGGNQPAADPGAKDGNQPAADQGAKDEIQPAADQGAKGGNQPAADHGANGGNQPAADQEAKGGNQPAADQGANSGNQPAADQGVKGENQPATDPGEMISVTIPAKDFTLGIADMTGELMRTAIMSVSAGDLDLPTQICKFMRVLYDALMPYRSLCRELSRKLTTLLQSLQKVENACYQLKVRGSEIPDHMLGDVFSPNPAEEFFVDDGGASYE